MSTSSAVRARCREPGKAVAKLTAVTREPSVVVAGSKRKRVLSGAGSGGKRKDSDQITLQTFEVCNFSVQCRF